MSQVKTAGTADTETRRVATRHLLHAIAILHPPGAASPRRFVEAALADSNDYELAHRARLWAEQCPVDDAAARRKVVGADLVAALARVPEVEAQIVAWANPEAALQRAGATMAATLREAGLEVSLPAIHLAAGLPAPYNPRFLDMVSIDATDAAHFGHAPGIHVDSRQLRPLVAETTVGHVLVHVAAGARSPDELGRGLEEGLAEVLGGLYAASAAIGLEAAAAALRARLATGSASERRALFVAALRGAAVLHRRYGIAGLVTLIQRGRSAIKQAELALASGDLGALDLPPGAPDPGLLLALEQVLLMASQPLVVSPLAFLAAAVATTGSTVAAIAATLGSDPEATFAAIRQELMERVFVLLVDGGGNILVSDAPLLRTGSGLRYELPTGSPTAASL